MEPIQADQYMHMEVPEREDRENEPESLLNKMAEKFSNFSAQMDIQIQQS